MATKHPRRSPSTTTAAVAPGKAPGKATKKKTGGLPKQYRSWHEYNEALVNRGRISLWIDPATKEKWYIFPPPSKRAGIGGPKRKRGRSQHFSDLAITATLKLGSLFGQTLRGAEGITRDLFQMLALDLEVPDFTTLCKRMDHLAVTLPRSLPRSNEPLHVIMDATGLKVFGEGEWKVRKYGYSCHRTWRKLHVEIVPSGEIRAVGVTENNVTDAQMLEPLLAEEEAAIGRFTGDGAYDKRHAYHCLQERRVSEIVIPPQYNARICRHGNCHGPEDPRDRNIREIRRSSRTSWEAAHHYHERSMVEAVISRFKRLFGDRLQARLLAHQEVEARVKASLLNEMLFRAVPLEGESAPAAFASAATT